MPWRLEWRPRFTPSPLTYWVHGATVPAPTARGYPWVVVERRGHCLGFASADELRHAIGVLSRRVLPRPSALAGPPHGHANQHWLSRFPTDLRSWRVRTALVAELRDALAALVDG
ncbi:MAG: hypothetical protein ABMB14_24975 [Myxococcota bacterium]